MHEADQTESVTGPLPAPSWARQHLDRAVVPVPTQGVPRHDDIARDRPGPAIPHQVVWRVHSGTGALGTLALVVTALMTVGGATVAAFLRTPDSVILPAIAASAFLIVRSQLTADSGRISLQRSVLEVQTRSRPRRFDLALPDTTVAMSESPDDPKWQLVLDDHQGPAVTLTRRAVPPAELAPIVSYYRTIADARAAERAFPHEH